MAGHLNINLSGTYANVPHGMLDPEVDPHDEPLTPEAEEILLAYFPDTPINH